MLNLQDAAKKILGSPEGRDLGKTCDSRVTAQVRRLCNLSAFRAPDHSPICASFRILVRRLDWK